MSDYRLDFENAMQKLEQVKREREALEASYLDFKADLVRLAKEGEALAVKPEIPSGFAEVLARLTNYVEMEREQSARLFELLLDAYARLSEAYED